MWLSTPLVVSRLLHDSGYAYVPYTTVLENEAGFVVSFQEGPWHSMMYVRASHVRLWSRTKDQVEMLAAESVAPFLVQDFSFGSIDLYHGRVLKRVLAEFASRRDAARLFGMSLHIEALDGSIFPDPT